jgi:methionyl-tRNA synthetase
LFAVGNSIRVICTLLCPILIDGSKEIMKQMGFNEQLVSFDNLLKFELLDNHHVNTSIPIYLRK